MYPADEFVQLREEVRRLEARVQMLRARLVSAVALNDPPSPPVHEEIAPPPQVWLHNTAKMRAQGRDLFGHVPVVEKEVHLIERF